MGTQYPNYVLNDGDDIGDPRVLNARFQDLDLRLVKIEDVEKDWTRALSDLTATGLARLDEVLRPAYQEIHDLANLGAIFSARSDTVLNLELGLKRLTIAADERNTFAPAAYMAAVMETDVGKVMLGLVQSFDRDSGVLELVVDKVAGGGTGHGWVLYPAASSDTADDRAAIADMRDIVLGYRNQTETFRLAAGAAAEDAAAQRDSAVAANTAAQSAKSTAESARDATLAGIAAWDHGVLPPSETDYTTRPGGAPLQVGDQFFKPSIEAWKTWKGSAWVVNMVPVGSEVVTVFGRSGNVTAATGDYRGDQISRNSAQQAIVAGADVEAALQAVNTRIDTVGNTKALADGSNLTGRLATTALAVTDWNSAASSGFYMNTSSGATNTPEAGYHAGYVVRYSASHILQVIVNTTAPEKAWRRSMVAGAWGAWVRVPNTIATQAEAQAGSDDTRIMTPLRTKQAIDTLVPAATTATAGKVQLATSTEGTTGTSTTKVPPVAVVKAMVDAAIAALVGGAPSTIDAINELAAAIGNDPNFSTTIAASIATKLNASAVSSFIMTLLDDADQAAARSTLGASALGHGHTQSEITGLVAALTAKLDASTYTAADVLSKIKTVDGNGSGLDADVVRGTTPSAFGLARLGDADEASARSGLGLGSAATSAASAFAAASEVVKLTGDQTVAGVKTFSSIPVGPAADPTTADQLARKGYVDTKVASISPGQPIPTSSADFRVGTVMLCRVGNPATIANGATTSGSNLNVAAVGDADPTGAALSGTWKNITGITALQMGRYLFVRTA